VFSGIQKLSRKYVYSWKEKLREGYGTGVTDDKSDQEKLEARKKNKSRLNFFFWGGEKKRLKGNVRKMKSVVESGKTKTKRER